MYVVKACELAHTRFNYSGGTLPPYGYIINHRIIIMSTTIL
nr:MAG TPA: hypothetical protein [Caudoviricetes sp.]